MSRSNVHMLDWERVNLCCGTSQQNRIVRHVGADLNFWLVGSSLSYTGDTMRFVSGSDCTSGAAGGTADISGANGDFAAIPGQAYLNPNSLVFNLPGIYNARFNQDVDFEYISLSLSLYIYIYINIYKNLYIHIYIYILI